MTRRYFRGTPAEKLDHYTVKSDGCWEYTGNSSHGYGIITRGTSRMYAHRVSYEEAVGPIPAGAVLDHLCRNTRCVRPDHLEPVSHAENLRRGNGPSAMRGRQTECWKGHPLSGPNLRVVRAGWRQCRECDRLAHLARRQRAKEVA